MIIIESVPDLLLQYIPRNMHTNFALLCFVMVIHWLIFPYPSGLLHWHCGNLTVAPVPAKQPWWIWINTSCEFIMNDCITTTKQSTTKPCAYFLGYTVYEALEMSDCYKKQTMRYQQDSTARLSIIKIAERSGNIVPRDTFCSKQHCSATDIGWLSECNDTWRDHLHHLQQITLIHQMPFLLTWINFNPSMDK